MKKDINYYMDLNYKDEEGGYVLKYPELEGCITCADTIDAGIELLNDAKKCWIETELEEGISIPEPVK